jgi:uncharacterized C2H2 Zn-finger protein
MLRHERTVHAAEKNLSCGTCQVLFPDQEALVEHCKSQGHSFPEKKLKKKTVSKRTKPKIPPTAQLMNLSQQQFQVNGTVPPIAQSAGPEDLDSWLQTIPTNVNVVNPYVTNNTNVFNQFSVQTPQMYGSFPNPQQQQYSLPVPDPAYSIYTDPSLIPMQHNNLQPGFVPNMNQVGYQMSTTVPHPAPKKPVPALSLDMSFQQPKFETEQPFFQFERQNLPDIRSPIRMSLFEEPFESVCDGLIIQENSSTNQYPPLPEHLLMDHMEF